MCGAYGLNAGLRILRDGDKRQSPEGERAGSDFIDYSVRDERNGGTLTNV